MRDEVRDAGRISETAIAAALAAGAHALRGFRSPELESTRKSDMHDLVTAYDGECEALIRSRLLEAFPDSSIVGEEAGEHAGTGPLTWYVDPIDGTSNYARGIAMWAISIAAECDGELVTGVIYDPVADQLFWADRRGAFLRSQASGADARDIRLHALAATDPSGATVALNFPLARDLVHFPELALEQFARVTRSFAQVRGLGSTCIALAWIAAGWIDVTISFETNPWDVAAGAYLIRQAGGVFHGYDEGMTVPTERSHLAPHYYAAGAGGEYELLHGIMQTQSRRGGVR